MEKNHTISPEKMSPEKKAAYLRAITLTAIGVALVLVLIKIPAWRVTGSVALLGSLIDSVLDLMISTGNFFVVRHALTPADREHRFGHGKAEALAALGQALVISVSALWLGYESMTRFIAPAPIAHGTVGISVIGVSIVLTLGLVALQRKIARQTGSLAVAADSEHYKGDLAMNLAILAGFGLSIYGGFIYADPILGLVVMLVLLNSAREIIVQSANQLMDHELSDQARKQIKEIIHAHPHVHDMHDLRTRQSGTQKFIQCHVEMDPTLTLMQAHHISDEIEASIMKAFPEAEVLIHQDPAGYEDVSKLEKS